MSGGDFFAVFHRRMFRLVGRRHQSGAVDGFGQAVDKRDTETGSPLRRFFAQAQRDRRQRVRGRDRSGVRFHVFVSRVRVGVNSRRFYQYRYRVYRLDAQERVDKGLSPFSWYGKILRTTHLDGAPVLLNILGLFLQNFSLYLQNQQRNHNDYLYMVYSLLLLLAINYGLLTYDQNTSASNEAHQTR